MVFIFVKFAYIIRFLYKKKNVIFGKAIKIINVISCDDLRLCEYTVCAPLVFMLIILFMSMVHFLGAFRICAKITYKY